MASSTTGNSIPDRSQKNDSIFEFHTRLTNPKDPEAEIYFFHDINWKQLEKPHEQTWTSATTPPTCWPRDWLKEEFPDSRILSAHYDAREYKTNAGGHMDLFITAENLRQDILEIYEKHSYETSCPIFLVGHGVGGLLIMRLVIAMQSRRDQLRRQEEFRKRSKQFRKRTNKFRKLNCFLKGIRGFFFYATPFHGSEVAELKKNHPSQGSLLRPLELFDTEICRIKQEFAEWRKGSECTTMAIHASLPTEVRRKRPSQVVTEASARGGDVDLFYSVQCNHFDVCRPESKIDSRYAKLVNFVRDGIEAAKAGFVATIKSESEFFEHISSYGEGMQVGDALFLSIDELEKIRHSPKMWKSLKKCFERAGVKLLYVDEEGRKVVWGK